MNDEIDTGRKILKKLRNRIKKKSELHNYFQELDPLLIAGMFIVFDKNVSRNRTSIYYFYLYDHHHVSSCKHITNAGRTLRI